MEEQQGAEDKPAFQPSYHKQKRKTFRRRNDGPWIKPEDSRICEIVLIPLQNMVPNKMGVHRMGHVAFQSLVREIERDGFDQPLIVIPQADMVGRFVIVDGVTRYYAAQSLGFKTLPAILKNWTGEQARMKAFRRNLLRSRIHIDRIDRGFKNQELTKEQAEELRKLYAEVNE